MSTGTITLHPVDRTNWRAVERVQVAPEQREFSSDTAHYLLLCAFGGDWRPLAVLLGDRVIGFLMWAVDEADGSCWLGGICIDRSEQGRGYGRQAILEAVALLSREHGFRHFALSYNPANAVAVHLYRSLGFVETGELEDDLTVARLILAD
jgi:diamine N-acetyltransferase